LSEDGSDNVHEFSVPLKSPTRTKHVSVSAFAPGEFGLFALFLSQSIEDIFFPTAFPRQTSYTVMIYSRRSVSEMLVIKISGRRRRTL
jgi:hypothetical protein